MDAEDTIVYKNDDCALIKKKGTARTAVLNTLHRHLATTLPQTFQRPAYKWVHSPKFPKYLKPYPQPCYDNRANVKILPLRFNCPHFIKCSSLKVQNSNTARLNSVCGFIKSSFPFQRREIRFRATGGSDIHPSQRNGDGCNAKLFVTFTRQGITEILCYVHSNGRQTQGMDPTEKATLLVG